MWYNCTKRQGRKSQDIAPTTNANGEIPKLGGFLLTL